MAEPEQLEEWPVTMNGNELQVEHAIVMQVVCNLTASFAEATLTPENFLRSIIELQTAFITPFKALKDVTLAANMHVLRAIFPPTKEDMDGVKGMLL